MNALFQSSLLIPFEHSLNTVLSRDRPTRDRLAQFSGDTLEVESTLPDFRVFVHFYPDRIRLGTLSVSPPRGRISARSSALLGLLAAGDARRPLVNPEISIGGDGEFVQDIYRLFQGLEINWQDPLANVIGDVATHALENVTRSMSAWARGAVASFANDLDEYIHEEIRLVPSRGEVDAFNHALDGLKLRIDRLGARRELLEQQFTQAFPDSAAPENNNPPSG